MPRREADGEERQDLGPLDRVLHHDERRAEQQPGADERGGPRGLGAPGGGGHVARRRCSSSMASSGSATRIATRPAASAPATLPRRVVEEHRALRGDAAQPLEREPVDAGVRLAQPDLDESTTTSNSSSTGTSFRQAAEPSFTLFVTSPTRYPSSRSRAGLRLHLRERLEVAEQVPRTDQSISIPRTWPSPPPRSPTRPSPARPARRGARGGRCPRGTDRAAARACAHARTRSPQAGERVEGRADHDAGEVEQDGVEPGGAHGPAAYGLRAAPNDAGRGPATPSPTVRTRALPTSTPERRRRARRSAPRRR